MKENIIKIRAEIDKLIDKTGDDAEIIAQDVKVSVKAIVEEIKSIDLQEEMENIFEDIDELAEKSGEKGKNLALKIGEQLDVLADRINLGRNYDKVNAGIDSLIDSTGDEAAKITEDVMDHLKKIASSIGSVDLKEDIEEIANKMKELAQATGKEAEEMASDIKEKVRDIGKKKE
ncbi:hypothetical protein [Methanolobus sp. WCC4]|uniref:hypothetical protein n=1 Tax=Methanolobus sp. WCC4 TaxID=3125784 RepID=UPI0030FD1E11